MLVMVFNFFVLILLIAVAIIYKLRFRNGNPAVFDPRRAWLRALMFFCCCFLFSWVTGTQSLILKTPLDVQLQFDNRTWLYWTCGLGLLTFFGYWIIWNRFTMRFDRLVHLPTQIPFGLLWGLSFGQLILTVWNGVTLIVGDASLMVLLVTAWLALGSVLGGVMLLYWDLYVVPEHDSRYSIALKTILVHIPNSLLLTVYLAFYDSYLPVIVLETIALVGASMFMRMPPFWSKKNTPPARVHYGPFGIPYAGGYISPDPSNDGYLRAAHLPY